MYSEADIEAAVASGAMTPEAAASLRAMTAERAETPLADQEHFRLLTGFNDIFVAIALLLFFISLGWLLRTGTLVSGLVSAAVSWGLAEFFTRRRHMALPSILLLNTFVQGVFAASFAALGALAGVALGARGGFFVTLFAPSTNGSNTSTIALIFAGAAAATAMAAYLHWRRFMVPITVAAGTVAVGAMIVALLLGFVPGLREYWLVLVFIAGIAAFAFAMWWDMSDTRRTTRRSDVAFWLHLVAAPLIIHPVFSTLGLLDSDEANSGRAIAAIVLYLALTVVALAIDRRAVLVSALLYVLYAIVTLLRADGEMGGSLALTGLIVGSALLLLSAFWQAGRRSVVKLLPADLARRLPAIDREASLRPAS